MGIDFKLEPLDCEPFYNGYGEKCSDPEITIAKWNLPITDLNGCSLEIPFYITKGNGILLLGNNVLSKDDILNSKNIVHFFPNSVPGLKTEATLPIYTTDDSEIRTHLHVVPTQVEHFKTFSASFKALHGVESKISTKDRTKACVTSGKAAKTFATRLHLYTHMTLRDMVALCKRGGIMNSVLYQALQTAVEKCSSCKTTGRPLSVRKISLNKYLRTFNVDVQIDFMWATNLTSDPILSMKDNATGFEVAIIASSRDMDVAARLFEVHWINQHGPPVAISADPEFDNGDFRVVMKKHGIEFKSRPARKHSKIGSVESSNGPLRIMIERLLADANHRQATKGIGFSVDEIVSRATFLCNLLRGKDELSPFELARGYIPSMCDFEQTPIDKEAVDAHHERVVRRALLKLLRSRRPQVLASELLPKGTPVYFYEKLTKKGAWNIGLVQEAKEHLVELIRSKKGRGKRLKVAYEDIRTFPSSSLLHEMDLIEVHEDGSDQPADSDEQEDPSDEHGSPVVNAPQMTTPNADKASIAKLINHDETTVWATHPSSASYFVSQRQDIECKNDDPMEIDGTSSYRSYLSDETKVEGNAETKYHSKTTSSPNRETKYRSDYTKDVGQTPLDVPPALPTELDSVEQVILRQIRDVIGDEQVSLHRLQFAPQWIIDKAIRKEMENFAEKGAYKEVHLSKLPKNANLISSHCFFQIKTDGTTSRLKLKCRLVPHGNRDQEKDNIRKDSATAQFPAIRLLLSTAAILGFRLGTIDISGAYLQSGFLLRDVYVRLPRGWTNNSFIVWKLLVPAYGLVESGRLWQLAVEEWMREHYGLSIVLGLAQLFVLRNDNGEIVLLIAKVVDDFLLAGKPNAIHSFNNAISKRFKVGRFIFNEDLIFNRLRISQDQDGTITVSMKEYLDKIEAIHIPALRRKQVGEKTTEAEFKALLCLAGKLNWLGHGVVPPAAYAASLLQQWTGNLRVQNLIDANKVLHEIRQLNPTVHYIAPTQADRNNQPLLPGFH